MNTTFDWAVAIGFVGTSLIIIAYIYVTEMGPRARPIVLHGLNLAGAGLLITSLLVHTNLPSLVLECIWAAIALWGLMKAFGSRSRP